MPARTTSARTAVKAIQDIMRKDVGVDGDAQRLAQLCWLFFLKIIDDQDQALELTEGGYRSPIPEHLQWRSWAKCDFPPGHSASSPARRC